jgi:myosin heavy subunit
MKRIIFVVSTFAVIGGLLALYFNEKQKLDTKREILDTQYRVATEDMKKDYEAKIKRIKENSTVGKVEEAQAKCQDEISKLTKDYQLKIEEFKTKMANKSQDTQQKETKVAQKPKEVVKEKVVTKIVTKEVKIKDTKKILELESKIVKLSKEISLKNKEIVKKNKEIEKLLAMPTKIVKVPAPAKEISVKVDPIEVKPVEVITKNDKQKDAQKLQKLIDDNKNLVKEQQSSKKHIKELEDKVAYYKGAAIKRDKKIYNLTKENEKLKNQEPQIKEVVKTKTIIKTIKPDCGTVLADRVNELVSSYEDYKHANRSYVSIRCGSIVSGGSMDESVCIDAKDENKNANMILNELEILTKDKNIYSTYREFIDKNRYLIEQ